MRIDPLTGMTAVSNPTTSNTREVRQLHLIVNR
jgi:hypothetical protein